MKLTFSALALRKANRNVIRQHWRKLAVFARRDAGELAELPVQVRLVAVVPVQGQFDPRRRRICRNALQSLPGIEESDSRALELPEPSVEQRDESPMAVAGFPHDSRTSAVIVNLRVHAPRPDADRGPSAAAPPGATRGNRAAVPKHRPP